MTKIPYKAPGLIRGLTDRGFTQTQIAEALDVSNSLISFWKTRRTEPNLDQLQALKDLYRQWMPADEATVEATEQEPSHDDDEGQTYGAWLEEQLGLLEVRPVQFAQDSDIPFATLNRIIRGLTENPQRATRERIEATIDSLWDKAGSREGESTAPKAATKLFVRLPFNRDELKAAPARIGVYVVHDRRGFPTYVGSGEIRTRLLKHWDTRAFADERVASEFSYFLCDGGTDAISGTQSEAATALARELEDMVIKFSGASLLLNKRSREEFED
jgi:transcriptional regulator with XRE-family HTH domain